MFVMIAPNGLYARKEPSDSSASAMKMSPDPKCAFVPPRLIIPPIAKEGSKPACCKATVSIEVVVVLPWVPATATDFDSDIRSAKAWARVKIVKPLVFAAMISGFAWSIALETTKISAPPILLAS